MIRLILIVAIAAVAWYLYRRITRGNSPTNTPAAPPANTQDIVRQCDHCGVHVPESNGVRYQSQFFCCPEHMNEHINKR